MIWTNPDEAGMQAGHAAFTVALIAPTPGGYTLSTSQDGLAWHRWPGVYPDRSDARLAAESADWSDYLTERARLLGGGHR